MGSYWLLKMQPHTKQTGHTELKDTHASFVSNENSFSQMKHKTLCSGSSPYLSRLYTKWSIHGQFYDRHKKREMLEKISSS